MPLLGCVAPAFTVEEAPVVAVEWILWRVSLVPLTDECRPMGFVLGGKSSNEWELPPVVSGAPSRAPLAVNRVFVLPVGDDASAGGFASRGEVAAFMLAQPPSRPRGRVLSGLEAGDVGEGRRESSSSADGVSKKETALGWRVGQRA